MNNKLRPIRGVACLGGTAAGVFLELLCLGCGTQPQASSQRAEPALVAPAASSVSPVTPPAAPATTSSIDDLKKAVDDARRFRPPSLADGTSAEKRLAQLPDAPLPKDSRQALDDLAREAQRANQQANAAAEAQRNPKFYVGYHYATESDRDDIEVRNSALIYTDLGPIDLAERQTQTTGCPRSAKSTRST